MHTSQKKETNIDTKEASGPAGDYPATCGSSPPSSGCEGNGHRAASSEPQVSSSSSAASAAEARYARIYAWRNSLRPLDSMPDHERRLTLREIERLAADPSFEPPPIGWKPPSFEEVTKERKPSSLQVGESASG